MANAKASKQSFLPPRSPFPTASPSYIDHGPIGPKASGGGVAKPRDLHRHHHHHQRTSSESFLIEEQPSWLDDLLNEPETPVRRGSHRRSSSDSFALFDGASFDPMTMGPLSSWGTQEYYAPPQGRGWEAPLNLTNYRTSGGPPMAKEKVGHHGSPSILRDHDVVASNGLDKRNQDESGQDPKIVSERKDGGGHAKHVQSDVDTKRAKQQYAQRSRVRKLQYIAELERKVQALQSEGVEASAEMEFLGQQNIMLDLENKALKQRLESLAQEQLIKRFQQEMFEREIARLRSLYQQQQIQQQQAPPTHGRSSSRDLDSQFANLSLKHKDPNSGHDPVSGPLRI